MSEQPNLKFLLDNPAHLLALGFGSGLARKAPGTFGSAAALPFWLMIASMPQAYQLSLIVLAFIVGILICDTTGKALGVHDHGAIVWDEFVGLWIVLYFAPGGWIWLLLGFGLFRFFDILKPWPIRAIDRSMRGGLGVMLDDVLAGLMAAGVIVLLARFI